MKSLCPKLISKETSLSISDTESIERLWFERNSRKAVLDYIKTYKVSIEENLLHEYKKEYLRFEIKLNQTMKELCKKYIGKSTYFNAHVLFSENVLRWVEPYAKED